ncbi:hypothetical protein [Longitalea luteola]|uniref:hypothetical protein n=1 Tax=Longitalea luteola TaxID=2812563 RepID=UPI001A961F1F|nr:hypothetical protein [Longitalea luteola]
MDTLVFPDVLPVFLDALNYPKCARPEYFIKKQKESGWSKGVYLRALQETYHHCIAVLEFYRGVEKRKSKNITVGQEPINDNFVLSIEKLTEGKQKGDITEEVLKDLFAAIKFAYKFERPTLVFTPFEILAVTERILLFVRSEFNSQIQKTSSAYFLADKKRKQGVKIESDPEYIVNHYHVISEAPIFDFILFRNEVRNLLLNSRHPQTLKVMLKPVFDLTVKIVDLWNQKLSEIEQPLSDRSPLKGKAIFDDKLVRFDHQTLQIWNVNIDSLNDIYREDSTRYMNRDFAVFATRVANLIADEVLQLKGERRKDIPELKQIQKLEDLFFQKDKFEFYVDLLKRTSPVVINATNQFLLGPRSKGALVAWISALKSKGIIRPVDQITLAALMNTYFKGVNFGQYGKSFSDVTTTSYKKYYKQILNLLS